MRVPHPEPKVIDRWDEGPDRRGVTLAALVTFPLVFGWLHFESVGQNGRRYQTFVGSLGTFSFDSRSVTGWIVFHLLDISAVLVLAGVFIFLARRLPDPGALGIDFPAWAPRGASGKA